MALLYRSLKAAATVHQDQEGYLAVTEFFASVLNSVYVGTSSSPASTAVTKPVGEPTTSAGAWTT